jgi:hypothetical protein
MDRYRRGADSAPSFGLSARGRIRLKGEFSVSLRNRQNLGRIFKNLACGSRSSAASPEAGAHDRPPLSQSSPR